MAAYNKFNSFVGNLANGQVNLGSDTLKLCLTNTSPTATQSSYSSSIASTEVANGNGYTTGGAALTSVTDTDASGTVTLAAANVVFTATTGSVGPLRYAVLYDSTASGTPLISWWDYGSSITLTTGQTLTVDLSDAIFTLS
jgi:hypothetical protein